LNIKSVFKKKFKDGSCPINYFMSINKKKNLVFLTFFLKLKKNIQNVFMKT